MKTYLKSILLTLLLLLSASEALAQHEKGRKSFGVGAGYVTRNNSATAGLRFSYCISPHLRFAPSIDYAFSNESTDGLIFNLDVQNPFQLGVSRRLWIYDLIGVSYTSWANKPVEPDVTTRTNRLGVNLGAGLEYSIKPSLKISVEARLCAVKGYSSGLFMAGIAYVF